MLRVLIVDDEFIERKYLRSIFDKYPEYFFIIGEASNGLQAIHEAIEKKPDVVIMDICMPGYDGLAASKIIKEQINPIIILNTAYSEFEYAKQALALQLDSYILKPANEEDILKTISTCANKINRLKKSMGAERLFYITNKEYPFVTITKIINSISSRNISELNQNSLVFLHFLESNYEEIFDYKIYILNSVFTILMALKDNFPQYINILFDSEQYLNRIAIPNCQRDILDTIKEILTKIQALVSAEVDTFINCSDMIQKFLDENFDKKISLNQLSEIFHYSPSYISRIFHEEKGITISEYLNNIRMEHSKNLLKNSNMTIKEIAFSSGFTNISHFNRVFKKFSQKTPTDIRLGR